MVENQTLLVGLDTNPNQYYGPLKYSWARNDLIDMANVKEFPF